MDRTEVVNGINPYVEEGCRERGVKVEEKSGGSGAKHSQVGPELSANTDEVKRANKCFEGDPWDYGNKELLIIDTINITSIITNQLQLHCRSAKVVAIQEHAAVGKEASAAINEAKENGWNLQLGPVDPVGDGGS